MANWSRCAMARASGESLRTGVTATKAMWGSWGTSLRSRVCVETVAGSCQPRRPFDSGALPEFRGSKDVGGSLNEGYRASCSEASGDAIHARALHRGHVRPTSFGVIPHVYHKKGIGGHLLPRSWMRMAFSTRPQPGGELQTYSTPAGRSMGDDDDDDRVGLHYTRHGSEFLVGVRGSREDVERIKSRIANFLRDELHLEVNVASHVHIQAGNVVFLGTRVAGHLHIKSRRRFSKEIEKRRRSKVRAQGMARIRTDTWHNELKDLAEQSWEFGLKKAKKDLQSWGTAQQSVEKKSRELHGSKFVPEEIDRGVRKDAIQRLLDKEEEVFMDAPAAGLPHQIFLAHERLTKLLKKHLDEATAFEKQASKAVETKSQQTKGDRGGGDDGHDDEDSIPIQLLAPMEIITEKLSKKGILQPSKALPTVVPSMLSSSDEVIVSYFTALGKSLLSYYRCCDNFEKIRRLVDHQVRWSALFTLGSKHGCSARKIIRQFSRGPKIVDRKGKVVVEFPSSPDIARTGKKFFLHEQQHSLDDILRSKPLEFLPSSKDKQGP